MISFAQIRAMVKRVLQAYTSIVRGLVFALAVVAGISILAMMLVTCLDVVMRLFRCPFAGGVDVVKITGAIAIACGLPYTTAVKGHVAIEYFFHKMRRPGRVVVDTVARFLVIVLFAFLSAQCITYGAALRQSGEVTPTLQIPTWWVLYLLAFSCGIVALVIFDNLLHPGKEMIKP